MGLDWSDVPRVGALILSYGTTDFLKPVIEQYLWTETVLVMNFFFPQSDNFRDDTPKIANELGVRVIQGVDLAQHEVLNKGLDLLKDLDLVFIADADEIILPDDQKTLVDSWATKRYAKGFVKIIDYAKGLNLIFEQRGHCPVVIAEPSTRFQDVRNSMGGGKYFNNVWVHHLGYLLSEEKLEWKRKKQEITNPSGWDKCVGRAMRSFKPPEELVKLLGEA